MAPALGTRWREQGQDAGKIHHTCDLRCSWWSEPTGIFVCIQFLGATVMFVRPTDLTQGCSGLPNITSSIHHIVMIRTGNYSSPSFM